MLFGDLIIAMDPIVWNLQEYIIIKAILYLKELLILTKKDLKKILCKHKIDINKRLDTKEIDIKGNAQNQKLSK